MPKPTHSTFEEIKDRIRRLRERTGHTPSSLAHAVDVTEGAIRQMESGQTKVAVVCDRVLLAREFGVTPEFLAFGEAGLPERRGIKQVGGDAVADLERRVATLERVLGRRRKR